jgi:hypothetical protein
MESGCLGYAYEIARNEAFCRLARYGTKTLEGFAQAPKCGHLPSAPTHNPTHKMRCLMRLACIWQFPQVFLSRCKTCPGHSFRPTRH